MKKINVEKIRSILITSGIVLLGVIIFALAAVFAVIEDKNKGLTVYTVTDTHVVANSMFTAESYALDMQAEKLNGVSEAVFRSFVDELISVGAEYLLISGDLTQYGDEDSAMVVAKTLKIAKNKGIKVFVINGNHDVGNGKMSQARFKEIFSEFGYRNSLDEYEGTLSYVKKLDDKHCVIAIDNVSYKRDDGSVKPEMDEEHRLWIYEKVDECVRAGLTPIIIAHKPFIVHFPKITEAFGNTEIKSNNNALVRYFATRGAEYAFVGHQHFNDIKEYCEETEESVYRFYDVMGSCLTMSCAYYRQVSFSKEKTEITRLELKNINADYLCKFVSDEERVELIGDYSTYAQKHLSLYMDNMYKNAVAKNGLLDLNSGGILQELYDVIREDVLTKCIDTPYKKIDENGGTSLERILESFDLALPDTEYADFSEYANDALFEIIAGEKNFNDENFEMLFKYTVYEVFYFMSQSEDKLNTVLTSHGYTGNLHFDVEKLFKQGELECYDSNLIPILVALAKDLLIQSLPPSFAAFAQSVIDELKTGLDMLNNSIISGMIGGFTDNIIVGYEQFIYNDYIDLEGLLINGLLGEYIADFVGENPLEGEKIIIKNN